MPALPTDLITAKQAVAEFRPLINSIGAFYELVRRGKFPTYGCTRRIFVSRAEVAEAMRGDTRQPLRAFDKLNLRGKMIFASKG